MATQVSLNSGAVSSAGSLKLQTNGTTDAVTIDTSQNLGLGVTPSAFVLSGFRSLEIGGVGSSIFAGANDQNALVNTYYNSGWKYAGTGVATRYQMNSGEHRWYNAASGTAGNAITFTQAMTLDASGNLGLGTSSPSDTIGYGRTLDMQSSTGAVVYLRNSSNPTTAYGFMSFDGAAGVNNLNISNASSAGPIRFFTNGSERARIDSSGNLLVGTTSASLSNTGSFWLAPGVGASVVVNHSTASSSGSTYAVFAYNASSIGSITQNGTTGVLYNLTSDYRLKNNPTPVTGAKEFVMALQPKTWDWWDGSGKGVGFIAHEFMEIAKHSGHGEKDAVDEEGNPVYQSIQPSSSEVMANLVAHIQELETRLSALEA